MPDAGSTPDTPIFPRFIPGEFTMAENKLRIHPVYKGSDIFFGEEFWNNQSPPFCSQRLQSRNVDNNKQSAPYHLTERIVDVIIRS